MKKSSEFPFSLEDRMGCTTSPIIAIAESFEAVRVVHREVYPAQRVVDRCILRAHIAKDRESSAKEPTIYYVLPASENPIQTHIASLRRIALESGATPEAIRLLGSLEPWTSKEERIMAEKLKSKASAAKPDKEGLKSAAKAAPVGDKGRTKNKGNADALAKARAAKGPDMRKYKPLVKVTDLTLRGWTLRMAQIALNNTTTAAATEELRKDKEFGDKKRIDFTWLANKGIISQPA